MALSLDPEIRIRDRDDRDGYSASLIEVYVPKQIRALRERRRMSQTFLGDLMGLSQGRLSAIEAPGKDPLTLKTLLRVARALDVGLLVTFAPFSEIVARDKAFVESEFNVLSYGDEREKGLLR